MISTFSKFKLFGKSNTICSDAGFGYIVNSNSLLFKKLFIPKVDEILQSTTSLNPFPVTILSPLGDHATVLIAPLSATPKVETIYISVKSINFI